MRHFATIRLAAALALAFALLAPPAPAAAQDLYKICTGCGERIEKPKERDVKFCLACGVDLTKLKYRRKSERELLVEAVEAKMKDYGDPKFFSPEEWYRRGETSEDELTKLACFRLSVKLRDDARVRSNIGAIFDRKGMAEEALAEFRRSVELDEKYAIGHNNLAKALLDLGKDAEARRHLDRAVELEPGNALFLKNRADLLAADGDLKGAEAGYRKALALDPDGPAGRLAAFKLSQIAPEPVKIEKRGGGDDGGK